MLMVIDSVRSNRKDTGLLTTMAERGVIVKLLKLLGVSPEG